MGMMAASTAPPIIVRRRAIRKVIKHGTPNIIKQFNSGSCGLFITIIFEVNYFGICQNNKEKREDEGR